MADDSPQTLVGISFGDAYRAQEFLTAAQRLAATGKMLLKDAVFVVKKADGATVVRETLDPQPGRTALSGAVWASLLGLLLGGPVGWLAGGAFRAGRAGRRPPSSSTSASPTTGCRGSANQVEAGTTTLALLVTDLDRDALVQELERFSAATLFYANLEPYWLDRIRDALGEVAGDAAGVDSASDEASVVARVLVLLLGGPCRARRRRSPVAAFDPIPDGDLPRTGEWAHGIVLATRARSSDRRSDRDQR